jgi:hypothetical protein
LCESGTGFRESFGKQLLYVHDRVTTEFSSLVLCALRVLRGS